MLNYGLAAAQIGAAADRLNALLTAVNQSAPELAQWSRSAAGQAHEVVNQAFRDGLILILVLLAGAVLVALLYRVLANRWTKDRK